MDGCMDRGVRGGGCGVGEVGSGRGGKEQMKYIYINDSNEQAGVRHAATEQREPCGKEKETVYSLRNKRLEASPFG